MGSMVAADIESVQTTLASCLDVKGSTVITPAMTSGCEIGTCAQHIAQLLSLCDTA